MAKLCGKNIAPSVNAKGRSTCAGEPTYGDYCETHREDDGLRRVVCGHPHCSGIAIPGGDGWCGREHRKDPHPVPGVHAADIRADGTTNVVCIHCGARRHTTPPTEPPRRREWCGRHSLGCVCVTCRPTKNEEGS